MATYSMTGYGRSEKIIGSRKYTIELRSLNSKQTDLTVKLPSLLREVEMKLRSLIATELGRGKIECMISYENLGEEKSAKINTDLMRAYAKEVEPLRKDIQEINSSDWLNALIKLPEVLVNQRAKLAEGEGAQIIALAQEAINALSNYRQTEGKSLEADLFNNIKAIEENATKVADLAPGRIQNIRDRINKSMEEISVNLDSDRFEQEMIYYIEKLDINEEIIRLDAHLKYFHETMSLDGAKGKKLGFISQEIGREINTMGSKANHAEMQRHVIMMKDNLERIKEQVLNVL